MTWIVQSSSFICRRDSMTLLLFFCSPIKNLVPGLRLRVSLRTPCKHPAGFPYSSLILFWVILRTFTYFWETTSGISGLASFIIRNNFFSVSIFCFWGKTYTLLCKKYKTFLLYPTGWIRRYSEKSETASLLLLTTNIKSLP